MHNAEQTIARATATARAEVTPKKSRWPLIEDILAHVALLVVLAAFLGSGNDSNLMRNSQRFLIGGVLRLAINNSAHWGPIL